MTLMRWFLALAAIASIALIAVFWREVPRWRFGGAHPVYAPSVAWGKGLLSCPHEGSRVAIYGDSHVEGFRGTHARKPFGKVFEEALGQGVRVDLLGVGGDTAEMGGTRWLGRPDSASIAIIAYGTNDAAPRGWLRTKQPVAIEAFKASLEQHIDRRRAEAATIVLMAPPPPGSRAMLDRIAPYRRAVAELGMARKIAVLDPADAFTRCAGTEPLLDHDALHMSAAGHQCLGQWLAEQFCPAARTRPQ